MAEVRRTVGLLGTDGSMTPAPSALDLGVLVDGFREAGLADDASLAPGFEGVPDGVGLAVYRIVQESLTNAARHGSAERPVRLLVDVGPDAVSVRIESLMEDAPVRVGVADDGGFGLRGMRARVAALGGTIEAGPADGAVDTWVVAATVPFDA
jgi:signal transduction histidine kinase